MKFLIGLLFICSVQAKFIKGESRFMSKDSDSLAFVKDQLLYKSFYEVIKRELKNIGLDADNFHTNYQDQFQVFFEATKERINTKYGIGTKQLSPKAHEAYQNELRNSRLRAKRKFKGIQKIISSFVIKKMSRSPINPASRYMSIEATVNRSELTKLYYSLVSNLSYGSIKKLYVNVNYNLKQTNWTEMQIGSSTSFQEVINKNWVEWLEKNKPENVSDIILVDNTKKELINEWLQSDTSVLNNTVMLYLNIDIEKVLIDEKVSEYVFRYTGNISLKDLQVNKFFYFEKLDQKVKKHFNVKKEDLQNILANYIYRYPIGDFGQLKNVLSKVQFKNHKVDLKISKFDSLEDVWSFTEALQSSGISLNLDAQITSLSSESAHVAIQFYGKMENLDNLLNRLKRNWPDNNLKLNLNRDSEDYTLELVRTGQEIPTT